MHGLFRPSNVPAGIYASNSEPSAGRDRSANAESRETPTPRQPFTAQGSIDGSSARPWRPHDRQTTCSVLERRRARKSCIEGIREIRSRRIEGVDLRMAMRGTERGTSHEAGASSEIVRGARGGSSGPRSAFQLVPHRDGVCATHPLRIPQRMRHPKIQRRHLGRVRHPPSWLHEPNVSGRSSTYRFAPQL